MSISWHLTFLKYLATSRLAEYKDDFRDEMVELYDIVAPEMRMKYCVTFLIIILDFE